MTTADKIIVAWALLLAGMLVFYAPPAESRELLSMIVGGLFALARGGRESDRG